MNITITFGSWLLPLTITCAAFFAAWAVTEPHARGMMGGLDGIIFGALSLIVSLIAWLIWAVLT